MPVQEHYNNTPITEALIDIRATLPPYRDIDDIDLLNSLATALEATYPEQQSITVDPFQFPATSIAEAPQIQSAHRLAGVRLSDLSQKLIVQARLDGFTFSMLAPYSSWLDFSAEARRLWSAYRNVLQPARIDRAAVRYVNQINIPQRAFALRSYFRTYPEISPDLPDDLLAGYFMQLIIPIPFLESNTIVNQTVVPAPTLDTVSIVLDLDLYRDTNVPQDEETLWALFEALREHKNAVFNACITEKTKELIR